MSDQEYKGKLYWKGNPEEFLELAMFVETLHFELMAPFLEAPPFDELGNRLQRIIRADLTPYANFTDLRMNGKPDGAFFRQKLDAYGAVQKEGDKTCLLRLLLAIEHNKPGKAFPYPEALERIGQPYVARSG